MHGSATSSATSLNGEVHTRPVAFVPAADQFPLGTNLPGTYAAVTEFRIIHTAAPNWRAVAPTPGVPQLFHFDDISDAPLPGFCGNDSVDALAVTNDLAASIDIGYCAPAGCDVFASVSTCAVGERCDPVARDGMSGLIGGACGTAGSGVASDPCTADADGDNTVGIGDFLIVLTNWGPCTDCPEDIDMDGEVGFSDVLEVLTKWGPCP